MKTITLKEYKALPREEKDRYYLELNEAGKRALGGWLANIEGSRLYGDLDATLDLIKNHLASYDWYAPDAPREYKTTDRHGVVLSWRPWVPEHCNIVLADD